MAKYVHGINGPLTGSLGNLVASSWRGIPYLKTKPERKKDYTANELKNQGSFGMTTKWLRPLTDHLRAGFKGDDPRKWGFNGAKSYLHAHALIKEGNSNVVDPSKVLISQGHLPLGKGFEMHFDEEAFELTVRWNPKAPKAREGGIAAAGDDKLMLAVYDVEAGQVYGEPYGPSRRIGMERVELDPGLVATYHVYVAFVSADGSSRSNSLYLGSISVGEEEEGEEEDLSSDKLTEFLETESIPQHADYYTLKQPLSRRPPNKLRPSFPDQSKHTAQYRWQSSTSSRQPYSYSYTYSDESGGNPPESTTRQTNKKTAAGFPSGRHLYT